MSVSRRGFFGMLAGLVSVPIFAPLAKIFPTSTYTTYLVGKEAIVSWEPNTIYNYGDRVVITGSCEPLQFRGGIWKMRPKNPLNTK